MRPSSWRRALGCGQPLGYHTAAGSAPAEVRPKARLLPLVTGVLELHSLPEGLSTSFGGGVNCCLTVQNRPQGEGSPFCPDRLTRRRAANLRDLAPLGGFEKASYAGGIEGERELGFRESGIPVGLEHRRDLEYIAVEFGADMPWADGE